MTTKEQWYCRLAGGVSGLLLASGNLWAVLAPLQLVALLPIFVMARSGLRLRVVLVGGLYMGLFFALPQFVVLRLPATITVTLLIYFIVMMMILAFGSSVIFRYGGSGVLSAFAVGAFLVVLDWANFTVVPIWGTAQSLGRCWSFYPKIIGFVSFTGITGVIFVAGTLQALLVGFVWRSEKRSRLLAAGLIVVLIFAAADFVVWCERPSDKIKVAAVGWLTTNEYLQNKDEFDRLVAGPAAKAAGDGAKLIVLPEMAVSFSKYERQEVLDRFGQVARQYDIFLVVGYFDTNDQENRLFFMTPEGEVASEYTKTYLAPFENYNKGTGQLSWIEVEGVNVGGMICQDDNFTDLSRRYGRVPVGLTAVPTLDWSTVKNAHLQSSVHRAIESRYAIVRGVCDGISAIVSAKGKILAQCDHYAKGPGYITAEVDVYSHKTIFDRYGHWLVVLSVLFLLIYTVKSCLRAYRMRQKKT